MSSLTGDLRSEVADAFNKTVVQRDLKHRKILSFPEDALFLLFETVSDFCGEGLSSAPWQGGTNQCFLLTRQIHTLSQPIAPKPWTPTSGVTSSGKTVLQTNWSSDVINYWLTWPMSLPSVRMNSYVAVMDDVKKANTRQGSSTKTASDQMPGCRLLSCQHLTSNHTHTCRARAWHWPQQQRIDSVDPWGGVLFRAFQQGWMEDRGPVAAAGVSAVFL